MRLEKYLNLALPYPGQERGSGVSWLFLKFYFQPKTLLSSRISLTSVISTSLNIVITAWVYHCPIISVKRGSVCLWHSCFVLLYSVVTKGSGSSTPARSPRGPNSARRVGLLRSGITFFFIFLAWHAASHYSLLIMASGIGFWSAWYWKGPSRMGWRGRCETEAQRCGLPCHRQPVLSLLNHFSEKAKETHGSGKKGRLKAEWNSD